MNLVLILSGTEAMIILLTNIEMCRKSLNLFKLLFINVQIILSQKIIIMIANPITACLEPPNNSWLLECDVQQYTLHFYIISLLVEIVQLQDDLNFVGVHR